MEFTGIPNRETKTAIDYFWTRIYQLHLYVCLVKLIFNKQQHTITHSHKRTNIIPAITQYIWPKFVKPDPCHIVHSVWAPVFPYVKSKMAIPNLYYVCSVFYFYIQKHNSFPIFNSWLKFWELIPQLSFPTRICFQLCFITLLSS